MSRIVYINGQFLPIESAHINIMDRGFLFADGIYDVSAVINGRLVDNAAHMARLQRSLKELKIPLPESLEQIEKNQIELIKQNNLQEGIIYMQVSRGVAERDFNYDENLRPTFVMFTQEKNILNNPNTKNGVKAITVEDIRWRRRDIKSIALLPQIMAKNEAREKGAFEAIMVENGFITEGSSANIFIVKDNIIITKNLSDKILHGITRKAVLQCATSNNLKFEERGFSIKELYNADECFLTSASNLVMGIVEVDGHKISKGKVGKVTEDLLGYYLKLISKN